MIFYLDSTLRDVNDQNATHSFVNFMEQLIYSRRNGRHIIYSQVSTLEYLAGLTVLSDQARATINKIAKRVRGKLAIFQQCTVYIRVVSKAGTFTRIVTPEGKLELALSPDALAGDEIFSKTKVLVENRTDGEFYREIALLVLQQDTALRAVRLNFDIVSGGGSQTPREYDALKLSEYLTLCIVDSDVDYHGAGLGKNTADPIYHSDRLFPGRTSASLLLNCYSAENLIPPSLIMEALNLQGNERWYIALNNHFNSDFWMVLALKSKKTCRDFVPGDAKTIFWNARRGSFLTPACQPVCLPSACQIFEPLKPSTLQKVVDYLAQRPQRTKINVGMQNATFDEWRLIAKNMFSWTCSGDKIST